MREPRNIRNVFFARSLGSLVLLVLAFIVMGGCGSDKADKSKQANSLDVKTNASTFAGPAPMTVQFTAKPVRSDGDVKYRWDFDGDISTVQNPEHTFKKAEFYSVGFTATDEGGHKDLSNLIVRAYEPKLWKNRKALAKSRGVKQTVRASTIAYYTKYPQALAYNAHSDFYKAQPYLLPILRKYERDPAVRRKHREQVAADRKHLQDQRRSYQKAIKKAKEKKKQQESGK